MDYDLIFVLGVLCCAFAIPALISAFSDRRFPRVAVLLVVLGGVSIAYAAQENPGVYGVGVIDEIFVDVIGRYLV
ncbi:hypothetical protein [Loktanella sp. S4079]|uniref:hypothetical protein n=1 Tax=Loktanella sp. S4079 TaxID=579483 RepID=UPI0005F9CBFC|nr:hypothetical protein [Loktanella sp. S4079]KJZ19099.1 hypothetical protein TW80_09845 [Loktanella sp. S4079]